MYRNCHMYNNAESRWCDQQGIPYVRDGYSFGPEEIRDLILQKEYYSLGHYGSFLDLFRDGKMQHKDVFQEDEWLIIHHSQRYVRAQIKEFGPRNGRMKVHRYNAFAQQQIPHTNYFTEENNIVLPMHHYPLDHGTSTPEKDYWSYRKQYYASPFTWETIPIRKQVDKETEERTWFVPDYNIFAVNKETLFKLKLLGAQ